MRHAFRYVISEAPRPGDLVTLSASDSHHLTRIVRRRPGDPVELIDGSGRIWPAIVCESEDLAMVRVGEPRPGPARSGVTLYVGLLDSNRLDGLVEKASELGVDRLVVFLSQRVKRVPEPDAWRRRRTRMRRVTESAARQAGRGFLPSVEGLVAFEDALAEIPAREGLLLDPRGDSALAQALAGPERGRTSIVLGPEAGFSQDEVRLAAARGIRVCRLGEATLRSETAGLVAAALALDALGHLGLGARGPGPVA